MPLRKTRPISIWKWAKGFKSTIKLDWIFLRHIISVLLLVLRYVSSRAVTFRVADCKYAQLAKQPVSFVGSGLRFDVSLFSFLA